jgi:hypothetical protein
MRKKAIILGSLCIIILLVVFFEFFVFKIPTQQVTSINEIVSNPSAWVNRTVVVEGNLSGPMFFMASEYSPYEYELGSESAKIGISWSGDNWTKNSVAVTIYGVVREGMDINSLAVNQTPITTIVYYIEANKVVSNS